MSQIIKFTPKVIDSKYTILTISEIIPEQPPNPYPPPSTPEPPNFKTSHRKVLRGSKR
jgi:hypothetical protein